MWWPVAVAFIVGLVCGVLLIGFGVAVGRGLEYQREMNTFLDEEREDGQDV